MAIKSEPFSLDKFGEGYTQTKEEIRKSKSGAFYKRHKKLILIVSGILCVTFLTIYFMLFFQQGKRMYDEFFVLSSNEGRLAYTAKTSYGKAEITRTQIGANSFRITYNMPANKPLVYKAEFSKADNDRENVIISDDMGVVFEGLYYCYDTMFLYDKNGEIITDDLINIAVEYSNEAPQSQFKDFKPTMRGIASIAKNDGVHTRGNGIYLLFAFFIFAFTAFDMRFPLAFFTLSHFMSVQNPEPTDFYIMMQRASWVCLPIIGLVLMIVSLF